MKHHSQELFELCTDTKSIPRRRARSVSPSAARTNQRRGLDQSSNSLRPKSGGGDELWDPWPDGDFERLLTWEEVLRTDNLSEHWACQPGGGDKRGSESALAWSQGKKTRRVCLGVITCDEPTCEVVTRPQTRRAGIMGQLNASCLCGSQLKHIDCGATSVLYSFKGGVYYIHKGIHHHPKQTHILHLSRDERTRFEQIVFENPAAGPAALIAGRNSITGTRESVSTISTVLLNQDRVKAELQALRGKSTRNFVDDFAEFQKNHPGYVLYSQFEAVTVVVVQTQFMVSQLVTDFIEDEAVNGIVSDAAHGFWYSSKDLLIISSTYSALLACWVPGLMTYANGVSLLVHATEYAGGWSGGAVADSHQVWDHLLVMLSKEISWMNFGRTKLRGLGEWIHSWDTPREEDLIQNFMSAEVSKELDDILLPHIASLQKLLDSPDLNQYGAEAYPVIDYILRSKKPDVCQNCTLVLGECSWCFRSSRKMAWWHAFGACFHSRGCSPKGQ
ncbi:uncharacterized protein F5891DRAFT_1040935 [Suillus fuscotomentosus]|uniref:Uncharacterized protein n=1 Tax=Suillus fuscotomentosus TaxID=1912939 RepID=A0AAD4E487_9AGAM|nr:uncharacterized protein F5891DRAFT_1040935 [Suillus fuscotomentosus]KAG1898981.1 hypothetical protein F5891DRAFT_1040935 [Suillus fuscotomentosus]